MSRKLSWGEHLWHSMHFVAMGYPEHPTPSDKDVYRAFYKNISDVLPCRKCAPHFREVLERVPIEPYLIDRKQLFTWTVLVHNEVNRSLDKPAWSVERAWSVYSGEESFDILDGTKTEYKNDTAKPGPKRRVLLLTVILAAAIALVVVAMTSALPQKSSKVSRTR